MTRRGVRSPQPRVDLRRDDDAMESSMTLPPIASRGDRQLGFVAAALRAFAFLEHLGFAVVRREPTLIRFESESVFINVYHGRSSYQVGLELGRLQRGELYSLHEVLGGMAPNDLDRARCQTADPATLARCLTSIADTVERNCQLLLVGNDRAFERLDSVVAPMRKSTTLQAKFGAILDRADKAWDQKNLSEAASLYERAAPALDEMRRRRLKYLRSRAKRP